jgi:hypothetical protein
MEGDTVTVALARQSGGGSIGESAWLPSHRL